MPRLYSHPCQPAAGLAPNGFGGCRGRAPFFTVPCEMSSGSSSRGPRGPIPFVRGHLGRCPASPPAVPARSGTIPAILVPSSGTCTKHTAGCPGLRAAAGPGQSLPAPPAEEETPHGQSKGASEEKQRSGRPRAGGSGDSQETQHPASPSCSPPAAVAATSQRFCFRPQCCSQSARVLKLPGIHAVPVVRAVLGILAVSAACAVPGVPGIPGVHGVLICTLW